MSADLRRLVTEQFEPGEAARFWVELDLDESLRFAAGLMVATDRRLLGIANHSTIPVSLLWSAIGSVTAKEHGALGALEVRETNGQTHVWRYTVGKAAAIHKLIQQIEKLSQGIDDVEEGDDSELEPDAPLSAVTQSFARLLRFTRPHTRMLTLGFVLTLLGSFFATVPMPLLGRVMDDVLVPFATQTIGRSDAITKSAFFLELFAGAVVISWLIGWWRIYVLAWVSERVAADLRNQTYAHLQRLSLEFFGGKRTGDLISRIDTDTDVREHRLGQHQ